MEKFEITCPRCCSIIYVPFMRELKASKIEEVDLLEATARDKLEVFNAWLKSASLFTLIKIWFSNKKF